MAALVGAFAGVTSVMIAAIALKRAKRSEISADRSANAAEESRALTRELVTHVSGQLEMQRAQLRDFER